MTDWLGNADDWGEDEEDSGGDPNGNCVSRSWDAPGTSSVPSTPSPVLGATGYHQSNLNSLSLAPLTLSSSGDGNANRHGEDSTGALGGLAARAEVEEEGEDEDCCVAMEELQKPETDIPSLFYAANRPMQSSSGGELKIAAHYLWVGEEKESDSGERGEALKEEERLLQEYKAREALEGAMGQGGAKGGSSAGEGWEKVVPSHGDELLHKMVEVIQKNPGQVLALKSPVVSMAVIHQCLNFSVS